jgi:SAM-dependent methyltransferase
MNAEEQRKQEGRERARAIASGYLERGDATGWFDAFYRDAHGDPQRVPWADREGHPLLIDWIAGHPGDGRSALVVGCGLGEDAELVARAGYDVAAFDVSPTAIEMCATVWPETRVTYRTADLLAPPEDWRRAFELVVEVYTVQELPRELQLRAMESIAGFVAPGGTLVAVVSGRGPDEEPPTQIPWLLAREELESFRRLGLEEVDFHEELLPDDPVSTLRWRVEYRRP